MNHSNQVASIREELDALLKAITAADEARNAGNEAKSAESQKAVKQHQKTIHELLQPQAAADPLSDRGLIEKALSGDDPVGILRAALDIDEPKPRRAQPVTKITGNRPDRLLSAFGEKGALLSVGGVLILAGEGGVAKSPLALSVALTMAAGSDDTYGALHGGLFEGRGGPTLVASYEDWPVVSADRLRKLADKSWQKTERTIGTKALARVHVLDLSGCALFGPVEAKSGAAFYNSRHYRLPGWDDLWGEVERTGARLVVIDPAQSAYVGDANNAAPVREFMGALAAQAVALKCGVLLVAHSNKSARGTVSRGRDSRYDPFDPGNVAGSTHWTDAARGVLTLTYDRAKGARPGDRVLAVSKANYGPSRILCNVDPVRAPSGEICGFGVVGDWRRAFTNTPSAESAESAESANVPDAKTLPPLTL